MTALQLAWKKIRTPTNSTKKINSYKFISDTVEFNFTMTLHSKLIIPHYWFTQFCVLSRTLGVMCEVEQPFTKNCQFLLHITLFLVHFNSLVATCSQSLTVSKNGPRFVKKSQGHDLFFLRLGECQKLRGKFVKTFIFFFQNARNFRKFAMFFREDHFFLRVVSLVFGLEHFCPWSREGLVSESRSSALASDFFCSWPWYLALCHRLHLCLTVFRLILK